MGWHGFASQLLLTRRRCHRAVAQSATVGGTTFSADDVKPDGTNLDTASKKARFVKIVAIDGDVVFTVGSTADVPATPTACDEYVFSKNSEWVQLPKQAAHEIPQIKVAGIGGTVNVAIVWGS